MTSLTTLVFSPTAAIAMTIKNLLSFFRKENTALTSTNVSPLHTPVKIVVTTEASTKYTTNIGRTALSRKV